MATREIGKRGTAQINLLSHHLAVESADTVSIPTILDNLKTIQMPARISQKDPHSQSAEKNLIILFLQRPPYDFYISKAA